MLFSLDGFQVKGHAHGFNCFNGCSCIPLIFCKQGLMP